MSARDAGAGVTQVTVGALTSTGEGVAQGSESAPGPAWPHRHLLDTDVLTWPQIEIVLDTARHMAEIVAGERPRSTALRGVGVTNLFYEASTRTRVSFEVAAAAAPAAAGDRRFE